jgi:hypothetical protein
MIVQACNMLSRSQGTARGPRLLLPLPSRSCAVPLPSKQVEPLKLFRAKRVFAPRGCEPPTI